MYKEDNEVLHFTNPKVQAALSSNTIAITGHAEIRSKLFTLLYSSFTRVYIYIYCT